MYIVPFIEWFFCNSNLIMWMLFDEETVESNYLARIYDIIELLVLTLSSQTGSLSCTKGLFGSAPSGCTAVCWIIFLVVQLEQVVEISSVDYFSSRIRNQIACFAFEAQNLILLPFAVKASKFSLQNNTLEIVAAKTSSRSEGKGALNFH